MRQKGIIQEILSVMSISFTEGIIAAVLLFALAMNVTIGIFNQQGAIDQSVENASAILQRDERYRATSTFINTNEYIGNAVIFSVWAAAGLVICNILFFLMKSKKSVQQLWYIAKKGGSDAAVLLEESAVRFAVRTLSLICLTIGTILFMKFVSPLILVALDTTMVLPIKEYAFSTVSAWVVLSLFLHFIVVTLRFLLLKKRLINTY